MRTMKTMKTMMTCLAALTIALAANPGGRGAFADVMIAMPPPPTKDAAVAKTGIPLDRAHAAALTAQTVDVGTVAIVRYANFRSEAHDTYGMDDPYRYRYSGYRYRDYSSFFWGPIIWPGFFGFHFHCDDPVPGGGRG